jgi:integrase
LASIRRRGNRWQVQVRRQGLSPSTRTFRHKADAETWARHTEAELDRGSVPSSTRVLKATTLLGLLERYRQTVTPSKRGANREHYKLRVLLRHPIAHLSLDRLTATQIAAFRDQRLTFVQPDTVRRELAILQHCLSVAKKEWDIPLGANPVREVRLPSPGRPRDRRPTKEELDRLLSACARSRSWWLPLVITLAVETGMRRGELLGMRWADVDTSARTIRLAHTKNGHSRIVPLSSIAIQLLNGTPRTGDRVFPVSANAFRLAWERLRRRAEVVGLRFHDLRHEAVSRFFEKGLSMPEVAAITGHRDARMLMRYTHPKTELIAGKLG